MLCAAMGNSGMSSWQGEWAARLSGLMRWLLIASLMPLPAMAQLAATGGHYAGRLTYGSRGVGAAGLKWDVPLSYIFSDTTIAHRRPVNSADVAPEAREQLSLPLAGQRIDLLRNATDTGWVARRNGPQLDVRIVDDNMLMYDGEGRTYTFSPQGPGAGTRLVRGNLYLLKAIKGDGGNVVNFE